MSSSSMEMAKAVSVPSSGKVLIVSDSTLRTYPTPMSGAEGTPDQWLSKHKKEMFRHINDKHHYYKVVGKVLGGATVGDLCDYLPSSPEDHEMYDCVIIVTNFNHKGVKGSKIWEDNSDVGVQFMKLCLKLRLTRGRLSSRRPLARCGSYHLPQP